MNIQSARKFGGLAMVVLLALVATLVTVFTKYKIFTLASAASIALIAVGGSVMVALITPKKEKMLAYLNIFLTVLLVSLLFAPAVTWFISQIPGL